MLTIQGQKVSLDDIEHRGSEESVLRHLKRYANSELATRLKAFEGKISYDYDWRINAQ